MPKLKPILFSTEMVKAILDGRKQQSRRVINPQPCDTSAGFDVFNANIKKLQFIFECLCHDTVLRVTPKYQVGDIIWVRETWLMADDGYYYKADESRLSKELRMAYGYKWKPSIFMPREAARIFLKVTNVRCERLQDISADDCFAEGMAGEYDGSCLCPELREFQELWDKINTKRGYGWDVNPWVWIYNFERIEKPNV